MNGALQGKLSEILELGKQGILQAADMIKEQMPDLVEQIFKWEFSISLLGFLLGFSLCIATLIITHKWAMALKKEKRDYLSDPWQMPYVGNLLHLAWAIMIVENMAWLKILLAPKLFLVEYISKLIK